MAHIFISYSSKDRERVGALASALEGEGHEVWWDRQLVGGDAFADDIERELEKAEVVLVCWSKDAARSRWVKDEAAVAAEQGKMVAASLDGSAPPIGYRQFHVTDLTGWSGGDAPTEILRAIFRRLSGDEAADPVPVRKLGQSSNVRRPALIAVGIVLVMALVAALFFLWPKGQADRPVIAVLPFEAIGNAGEEFADGLSEELIGALSHSESLDVIARSSSFGFRGSNEPLPQIAQRLGATHVFEGSVQRNGTRIRVNARLVDGGEGVELWSERFERDAEEIFAIQTEIAEQVARAAGQALASAGGGDVRPTRDAQAYELYLRAKGLWAQRGEQAIRTAITLLTEATERDPEFAEAWSLLGLARQTLPSYAQLGDAANENWRQARSASQRALALDPGLSGPYVSLATFASFDGDFYDAEQLFLQALERSPSDQLANYWYGEFLRNVGRSDAAREQMDRALKLDPLSPVVTTDIAMMNLVEDPQKADRLLDKGWNDYGFKPPFAWEGRWLLLLQDEDWEGARAWLPQHPIPPAVPTYSVFLDALSGRADADEAARQIAAATTNGFPYFTAYSMLNMLEKPQMALDLVKDRERFSQSVILFFPTFGASRRLDGFWPFVDRLGYIDYWRESGRWPDFCVDDGLTAKCREEIGEGEPG